MPDCPSWLKQPNKKNMKLPYIFLTLAASIMTAFTATNTWANNQLESTGKCPGCNLAGVSLVGIDLANADLTGANLNSANFAGANLTGANLSSVSAVGANFLGADLTGANLEKATFVYGNLVKVKLNNATLDRTDMQSSNLAEADLTGAKVTRTDFVGANLYNIKASASLRDPANRNIFKRAQSNARLKKGSTTVNKPVTSTFEAGGRVIKRRYRIPMWVGTTSTTTVGGNYYHKQDPDLILELW
jgi:uncharacterized protein YjbI with pentapeptide repeats